ncbi:uncharacterized protein LOC132918295 [Rhopalosiphum padi]|uniref:uncharacterized protein LOC132918295 n=1 Tax=Rhopalosiphum padi TaxID=40932 RepID=UPI00298D8A44|nr:uncharacterized protein LOC132918295 [Rhopalosiphum padi]
MADVVSPIVIIKKNTVLKLKMKANPTKRALSSSSPNSPVHEDKKSKFFVSLNRFEVLRTDDEKQDIADLPVSSSSGKLPYQNNLKLSNIVLKNETCKSTFEHGTDEEITTTCKVLLYVLDTSLRLMSPVMLFLSETLYCALPGKIKHKSHILSFLSQLNICNGVINS